MTPAATYILIALWPIGGAWVERQEAATTKATCELAAYDALHDIGRPLDVDGPAREARCIPGAIFPKNWDCIATARPTAEYHCGYRGRETS